MKLGHPIITAKDNGSSGSCESELIRLNLNKPKSWRWELTTSKSSPNIVFPTIQLFDAEGSLLAETNEAGCIISSNDVSKSNSYKSNSNSSTGTSSRESLKSLKKVSTVVDDNGNKCIVKTNFIPGPRKSRSCQDMKRDNEKQKEVKDDKKYRRSFCVNSNRLSNIQEIQSSDSDDNGNSVKRKPRYIYRTCSAGTLVVSEDSYRRYNRRRPKGKKYVTEDDHKLNDDYRREERRLKKIISSGAGLESLAENNNEELSMQSTGKESTKSRSYRKSKTTDLSSSIEKMNAEMSQYDDTLPNQNNSFIKRRNSYNQNQNSKEKWQDSQRYQENNQNIKSESKLEENKTRRRSLRKSASSGSFAKTDKCDNSFRKLLHDSYKSSKSQRRNSGTIIESSLSELTPLNGSSASVESTSVLVNRRRQEADEESSSSTCKEEEKVPKKVKRRQLRRRIVRKDTERPRPRDRLDLKLHHAPWRGSDGGYDQGYGSERSPEEEFPPSLPGEPSRRPIVPRNLDEDPHDRYPFITPDCTFTVSVTKGPRGLGLSVSGGIDSRGLCPGLIRIKRLFPHQPAWGTGRLAPGDLLLEANGVTLTGLSNYEALEVLRMTPSTVVLTVCRPPGQDFARLSPPTEPPPPPRRGAVPANLPPLPPLVPDGPYGEFDIIMHKQSGSLGFTLRKEDQSVLGHYVRALVREPALSDGRIRPGDRILAVNNVAMCSLSHEEAVAFLRQCGEEVRLRLYRDSAQTPLSAVSPTESEAGHPMRSRPHLRQEAMDMLYDLAARKLSPGDSLGSSMMSQRSPSSSARRLRRLTRTVTPEDSDVGPNHKYYPSTASPSDSEGSINSLSGSTLLAPVSRNATFTMMNNDIYPYNGHGSHQDDNGDKPRRPNFLDLCQSNSAGTPVVSRKPCFQFTAANSYELNNLDNDVLDAPTVYTLGSANGEQFPGTTSSDEYGTDPDSVILASTQGPMSMPQLSGQAIQPNVFSHRQPVYQSAHPTCKSDNTNQNHSETGQAGQKQEGTKSLMKWKGVMFTPEEEASANATTSKSSKIADESLDGQILMVELNRGWNSRLGFSLQADKESQRTVISAIYADSVAAKDGRLREGDQLLMVNDETIEHMTTTEVIDLLRIIRGSICIKILRKNNSK